MRGASPHPRGLPPGRCLPAHGELAGACRLPLKPARGPAALADDRLLAIGTDVGNTPVTMAKLADHGRRGKP